MAFDTYSLGTVTNFKQMILQKFGAFDYKNSCSPEVLAAITQQFTEKNKFDFVTKFAEENSLNPKLFG